MYTKHIVEDGEALKMVKYELLIDLYIFGDKFGISDLQDAAIDVLIDKANATKVYPTSLFDHVYRNTGKDSRLRKLCVDWTLWRPNHVVMFEGSMRDRFPKDFLVDLATAYYGLTWLLKGPKEIDFASKRSDYHVKSL